MLGAEAQGVGLRPEVSTLRLQSSAFASCVHRRSPTSGPGRYLDSQRHRLFLKEDGRFFLCISGSIWINRANLRTDLLDCIFTLDVTHIFRYHLQSSTSNPGILVFQLLPLCRAAAVPCVAKYTAAYLLDIIQLSPNYH